MLITVLYTMVVFQCITAGPLGSRSESEGSIDRKMIQKRFFPWPPVPTTPPAETEEPDISGDDEEAVGFHLGIPYTEFDDRISTNFLRIASFNQAGENFMTDTELDWFGKIIVKRRGFYWLQIYTQMDIVDCNAGDHVSVGYCIDDQCGGQLEDMALYRTVQINEAGPTTVEISGILQIQANQKLLVYIEKSSTTSLQVLSHSSVTGMLV